MTSLSLPAARRRFLAMLWFSAAVHAAVLGLTRLPPPLAVPLSPELRVRLQQPAPVRPESAQPPTRPAPLPLRPAPIRAQDLPLPAADAQSVPQPVVIPALAPAARQGSAAPPSPPITVPSPEAPGPQISLPLAVDEHYYSARELDIQPVALKRPEPVYPFQAEAQQVSGRVVVRLHLEIDGGVSKIEVVSVAPRGVYGELFRQSTLDSLKVIRFRPAERNGQPVRAVVEIPVVFEPDR